MVVRRRCWEMLPGSASKVLEAILPLVQAEARIQHSRVYQSLANLIRWSDQVMLDCIDLEDKENVVAVTAVIKAELVKLTIEKQEQPSPVTPSKPVPPAPTAERSTAPGPAGLPTPSEAASDAPDDDDDDDVAPPKPPLPEAKMAELSPPPALPPKKRQSAPSPTRVAVVAPMSRGSSLPCSVHRQQHEYEQEFLQRRFSGGSQSYGGESPRLSPCSSMGKLSKSEEQLSSLEQDSGQCSRNTSCETLDNTESYDPDYDFLHQDLSAGDHLPQAPGSGGGCLSPLPESHNESSSSASSSPVPGAQQHPQARFSAPPAHHATPDYWTPQPGQHAAHPLARLSAPHPSPPPALPQKKKRRSTQASPFPDGTGGGGARLQYERYPSQYDNLSEEELHPTPPFPLFTPISPMPQSNGGAFVAQSEPEPLTPSRSGNVTSFLQYMQFVEDYSEPQPSVFYQMPQSESIYEQRNKRFQEVCGFNDSFSSTDSVHEPVLPPALPPKQRQLASHSSSPSSSSSSSLSCHLQPSLLAAMEEAGTGLGLSMSVSSSYLIGQAALTTPTSLDHAALTNATVVDGGGGGGGRCGGGAGPGGSPAGSLGSVAVCLPLQSSLTDSLHTSASECDEAGEGDPSLSLHRPAQRMTEDGGRDLAWLSPPLLVELTEDIQKQLMDLVFRLVCNGELSLARVLRKNILDKVEQKKQLRYTNSVKPLASRGVSARPGTLHDFRSHEIADQLTLLDAELFYKIEIPEVLLWAKEQNEEKSPNLTQFTEHFNNMSYWVRSLIIQQEKAQDREKLLLKFIKIMKGLEEYCTLIDSSSSFRAYRAALAEVEPPCIPYLHYELKRNDDIVCFFNEFSDHLAEEALWELSLKIKPRNITRRRTEREEKT
ncbi:hypothetical protein CRUP_022890 [Coryphaenoides rupestris]|nr:hypothetical protein CRUP_022890 [Coryphaenoides rupestris]